MSLHDKLFSKPAVLMLSGLIIVYFFWSQRALLNSNYDARELYWGIPAMILLLCFFMLEKCIHFSIRLVEFGNRSFSFYLVHSYVIALFRRIFDLDHFHTSFIFEVTVVLIAVSCVSFVVWKYIEVPLNRYTKVLLQ